MDIDLAKIRRQRDILLRRNGLSVRTAVPNMDISFSCRNVDASFFGFYRVFYINMPCIALHGYIMGRLDLLRHHDGLVRRDAHITLTGFAFVGDNAILIQHHRRVFRHIHKRYVSVYGRTDRCQDPLYGNGLVHDLRSH